MTDREVTEKDDHLADSVMSEDDANHEPYGDESNFRGEED